MNTDTTFIHLSFIVPVYNVEKYLKECIDSLLKIRSINIEVVLIDDGSTDSSGRIADQYASFDNRIKVTHQKNRGLAAARNRGIYESQGEYVAFVDSDDWIFEHAVETIYKEAKNYYADMAMGNMLYCYPDGSKSNPFSPVPVSMQYTLMSGKGCFVKLMQQEIYLPMVCNYLYRKEWMKKNHLHFTNIVHEDELWTPVAFCAAQKVIISNIYFYGYRQQREDSITNSLKTTQCVSDLIFISNQLILFGSRFSDSSELNVKSQLYAQAFKLYARAFSLLPEIRDSSYVLPSHFMQKTYQIVHLLTQDCKRACRAYYSIAVKHLKEYMRRHRELLGERLKYDERNLLILIYNTPWNNSLRISNPRLNRKYNITVDHKYIKKADIIVFYLPSLYQDLVENMEKDEKQHWMAWDIDGEIVSCLKKMEIQSMFDFSFSCGSGSAKSNTFLQNKFISQLIFNISIVVSILNRQFEHIDKIIIWNKEICFVKLQLLLHVVITKLKIINTMELTKLKLHDLSKAEMAKRELNLLKGGVCACVTSCLCSYAGTKSDPTDSKYGGSSTSSNENANAINAANGNTK